MDYTSMQISDYFLQGWAGAHAVAGSNASQEAKARSANHQPHTHEGNEDAIGQPPCIKHPGCADEECGGRVLLPASASEPRAEAVYALAIAEASIALHSVIIGVALAVTSQDDFTPLLIALCFHQVG